jgi:hypothetical protein
MRTRRRAIPVLALAATLGLLAPRPAAAQTYGEGYTFGIGAEVGNPMAFTMKWLIADGHALQGNIGFDLSGRDGLLSAVDWVWHPLIIVSPTPFDLSFHVGAGFFLGAWWGYRYSDHFCHSYDPATHHYYDCDDSGMGFGAHFPVGLDFFFKAVPIELSLEFAPGLWFYPWVDFAPQGGVIGRYFF